MMNVRQNRELLAFLLKSFSDRRLLLMTIMDKDMNAVVVFVSQVLV